MDEQLKTFLDRLARVSPHPFLIRDEETCLYASPDNGLEGAFNELHREFSAHVLQGEGFRQTVLDEGTPAFGCPLQTGQETNRALIVIAPDHSLQNRLSPLPAAKEQAQKTMEPFVTSLAAVIEDNWRLASESEEMTSDLMRHYEEFNLFSRMGTQTKTFDFSKSHLEELLEEIQFLVETDLVFADLPDHPEYTFTTIQPGYSGDVSKLRNTASSLIETISRQYSDSEETYFILNNSKELPEFRSLHPEPYRCLAVKIRHDQTFFGWLGMVSFDLGEFFQGRALKLLSALAEQTAVAIVNAGLYHDLAQFTVSLVKTLVHVIEAKDEYTRGHSVRVHDLCMQMADRLGLDEASREDLHWAAMLHDIGKIGTPGSLLSKPGKLTPEEYNIIKYHPVKGHTIIEPLEQLAGSLPGVLHHHERIDGLGYPSGLAGEEIPYQARIIAVADTYDAITSDRAYRRGRSHEQAVEILQNTAGTQLDKDLVALLIEILDEERDQLQSAADREGK